MIHRDPHQVKCLTHRPDFTPFYGSFGAYILDRPGYVQTISSQSRYTGHTENLAPVVSVVSCIPDSKENPVESSIVRLGYLILLECSQKHSK